MVQVQLFSIECFRPPVPIAGLPHRLLSLTPSTLEASMKIAKYALHYQPIRNTIAQQNKLLEIQHNLSNQGQHQDPVFFSSLEDRASRKMEDREIFFFENSMGNKQRETSTKLSEESMKKARLPSDSSNFLVNKRILPSFLPSDLYALYIWS